MKQLPGNKETFVEAVVKGLSSKAKFNQNALLKMALGFGIDDKTEVKELTELAIVRRARFLASQPGTTKERFDSIVDLYNIQANLSYRTSNSILLQQYSTPAPIGYLAGIYCGINNNTQGEFFEPSAGNGLLTIAGNPAQFTVNEIDPLRNSHLQSQPFRFVSRMDATVPFMSYFKKFDAVLTNPPFGVIADKVYYETFGIHALEQYMALRALDCMKDNGRAAIIIGGHTRHDAKGRVQAGKNRLFLNYLYSRYFVDDIINIDGRRLFSRQGTGFHVRLILINGRKIIPEGNAPVYDEATDTMIHTFPELYDRVTDHIDSSKAISMKTNKRIRLLELEAEAVSVQLRLHSVDGLDAPYIPASQACVVLNTQVPDSMAYETQSALELIRKEVGGDIDNFVRHRLNYPTKAALCKVLSAEQIDAVAMAIYNCEARGQGMVIGDQTGIGKGRVAAAMIRYAVNQGLTPVFLTEKANLFSDIYRDLYAIGSGTLQPFIVNNKESKTDIKDEDGNIVYQAPASAEQQEIISSRAVPGKYQFILATYSQFNSPEKKPQKPDFLMTISHDNIFIMDEAHNASGSGNTGEFLQKIVRNTRGVVFLSATFAKRPDNMPIYAMRTAISDCNMTKESLIEAIQKGGVALQEVLSSQLVAEGQMLRRERSFEGVEVNYITLEDKAEEHKAIADNITDVLRDIIAFQNNYVNVLVDELDDIAVAEGKEVELREGTTQAGVDNMPYFSKIFQVINQMLFSLKAEAVVERTIARLKQDKKVIIAFSSTMGSFIETMSDEYGMPVSDGVTINVDFSEVLRRGLEGVLRYTVKGIDGNPEHKYFDVSEFSPAGQIDYRRIVEKIQEVSTGITVSPIDVILRNLKNAGYTVTEVTGRKYELQIDDSGKVGLVRNRKRINTNDAFRQFNNNEVDVLLINQSGSTGASAHAIPTAKVPPDQVKQRVMIVLQAELDISTEVQKRGRINRTGQLLKPIYDYVTSAIPAERRLMMMLQKKLKSLDANTTSNQKQSSKILDVPDFLNKYGDKVVREYLFENPAVNKILDDPLRIEKSSSESPSEFVIEEAASKVSGRVAVLSTKMQEEFYQDISERYHDYTEYLRQVSEYDLEVEAMNLEAELVSFRVLKMGKGTGSAFGDDSNLETIRANVLKKPYTVSELENIIRESLKGLDPFQMQTNILNEYIDSIGFRLNEMQEEVNKKYDALVNEISLEKNIRKLEKDSEAWIQATQKRESELNAARQLQLKNTEKSFANRKNYLERILKYFFVGKLLQYPIMTFGSGTELVPAVFLGFNIDSRKKNPFAPSAIKLRIAIANSSKYLALPASYSEAIMGIMGATGNIQTPAMNELYSSWEEYTKENNVDRKIRHVITGNLLQAFSDVRGKLVSYTTMYGEIKKGILLPEHWNPREEIQDNVVVPILKALPIIKSLPVGQNISTSNGLSMIRIHDSYKLIVAASRLKAGDIYLDSDILKIVKKNIFEKVSDKMVAYLPDSHIRQLIEILQTNHSDSVTLKTHQLKEVLANSIQHVSRKPIELPPLVDEVKIKSKRIRMLELEAEAVEIMLRLLAA